MTPAGLGLVRLAALIAWLTCLSVPPASAGPISDRIYHPTRAALSLARLGPTARLLAVRTDDGLALTGILVPPRDRPVLLVLHGSGASADDVGAWLAPVAERGYGLVLAEYRGFAGNPGEPSEQGLAMDARAFLREARSLFPGQQLFVVGHSLGGGAAFDLALAEPVDALITIGTFIGLREVAPAIARPFIHDRFDNLAALRRLRPELPYYLLHGTADQTIPPGNASRLHDLAVELKRPGASFVLAGQPHRPDAALIAGVLDAIVEAESGNPLAAPAGARAIPFR